MVITVCRYQAMDGPSSLMLASMLRNLRGREELSSTAAGLCIHTGLRRAPADGCVLRLHLDAAPICVSRPLTRHWQPMSQQWAAG